MENTKTKKIKIPKIKRLFDLAFSSVLLVLLSPLFLLVFFAILVENIFRGNFWPNFFYHEKRVSEGKMFNFMKFNIFRPGVIENLRKQGTFIHTKKLERDGKSLSVVGKILQKIYFDELPQLVNIFKGDLSVVGPRPVNKQVYKSLLARGVYTKKNIRCGLTGIFQAHKGDSGANQDKLDQVYIDFCATHSGIRILFYDIKIILRTVIIMLRAQGI